MAPLVSSPNAVVEGVTERFDPIECLDGRARRRASAIAELEPGRYLEVQGPRGALLIPLGEELVRIGRGVAADLHLDEPSVSRRHAILEPGEPPRILDDRSSNGTFLNGLRVQQASLRNGDVISVGRVVLRYLEVAPPGGAVTR
jgi:pSer/pThr/pTyr-binding forkhead associated (FHA) protein